MPQLTLNQFPLSHYCEKIRWVLDHKRLAYKVQNQFPGLHMLQNRRLVGRSTVPVLLDGHHAVGESSEIALYLDDQFPEQRLIPGSGDAREAVLTLEGYFDRQAGPAVRRFVYSFLTGRVSLFRKVFFRGYSGMARVAGSLASSAVAKQIATMYQVGPDSAAESRTMVEAAFRRLEELTQGDPDRYLVGSSLTLADVTAASLLAPLVGPAQSPWTMELEVPELVTLRESLRARPGGRWVIARYERDRHRQTPSRADESS